MLGVNASALVMTTIPSYKIRTILGRFLNTITCSHGSTLGQTDEVRAFDLIGKQGRTAYDNG